MFGVTHSDVIGRLRGWAGYPVDVLRAVWAAHPSRPKIIDIFLVAIGGGVDSGCCIAMTGRQFGPAQCGPFHVRLRARAGRLYGSRLRCTCCAVRPRSRKLYSGRRALLGL